jgi:hypothetical protein
MSATQRWFGALAVKSRSSRSPGRAATSAGTVVRLVRPRTAPDRPRARIRRCTVHRATDSWDWSAPSRFNVFHILRTP